MRVYCLRTEELDEWKKWIPKASAISSLMLKDEDTK